MVNGARGKASAAIGGMVLAAITGGLACDPSTPEAGSGAPDAGADRFILIASSGGASCIGVAGGGGTPAMPSTSDGVVATGGAGAGAVGSGGAHGGTPGSASGGHGGTGGAAGIAGRGGEAAGGAGGVAVGSSAGGAGAPIGTGGVGGPVSTGGGAGATVGQAAGGAAGGSAGAAGRGVVPGEGGAAASGGSGGLGGSGGSGGAGSPPAAGELAIVELLINPAGTDTGREWIEVVNRTTHPLELAGLHIADAANDAAIDFTTSGFTTASTTILPAGARAVLIQSADPTKNGGVTLGVTGGVFGGSFGTRVSLNNDADTIRICSGPCAGGVVIDQFAWDTGLGADYDDHALSIDEGGHRCPALTPFGDAGSFGTPGLGNPPCP